MLDNSSFFLVYKKFFHTIYCGQKALILLTFCSAKNPLK